MDKTGAQYISKILGVSPDMLGALNAAMERITGRQGVLDRIAQRNESKIEHALETLSVRPSDIASVRPALLQYIAHHEAELLKYMEGVSGKDEFEKAASLARDIAQETTGFFLKKEHIARILVKRPPAHLLEYLGYSRVEDLLAKENLVECFSALRFVEDDTWMHETFENAYSAFTPDDFEVRSVEIKVLGPQWLEIAKKFVAKKHHNVSHLKEFGVIFINPIKEGLGGKFLRDFALLLHYIHEIRFYSKLFERYAKSHAFMNHVKSALRGDVRDVKDTSEGEWLIVQRYLVKENPSDPRLFLPRVNPESMHWRRGEIDLTRFARKNHAVGLEFWGDLDWVGSVLPAGDIASFDLEDNAMSLVSKNEGREGEYFTYHQREALWTYLFSEYAGGEDEMERLIVENFEKGYIGHDEFKR
ncbi:MAG: hypothetical protein UX21_C0026G0003 [Microgenomates group bacterium GW2011_GWC2_45_8]|nr:MAG: hypothetical protein UX21_C0026G0003 [Microgenomates group bacterium GW2011_GWC2_45_8]